MSSEVFLLLPNIKNFPSKIEKPAEEAGFWLSRQVSPLHSHYIRVNRAGFSPCRAKIEKQAKEAGLWLSRQVFPNRFALGINFSTCRDKI
jgi:hypothetical protein